MYQIFANGTIIFDDVTPLPALKLLEPKLTLEENNAGKLEFKVSPENSCYNSIHCMTTELIVKQDSVEIWRGRVISEEIDFWKCKKYTAEGELAYLNDSVQLPKKYVTGNTSESGAIGNTTIRSFLVNLINNHNSQVGNSSNKLFNIGSVTVDDGDTLDDSNAINRFTNYESTLKCINEKLLEKLGGHLRIRHSGNARYLDYFKNYNEIGASDQEIRFGVNLLEFVSNLDSVDWVTAICPKGKRLEIEEDQQPVKGLEAYTNVSTASTDGTWHTYGSMFVSNQNMINQYGFIAAVVDWDEVTDVNTLKNKAKKYLQSVVFDQLCLEISAVDLHYLNPSIETFKLQETVHCISEPHGMDTSFPVTKIEIDLNNPANTKYTLGTKVSASLTAATNKANSELVTYVNDTFVPTESKILNEAKENATNLINGAANGGVASWIYGTDGATGNAIIDQTAATPMKPTGIRVADTISDANAKNRWLWTTGGLGHYHRDNTSTLWKNVTVNTAMTMDGKIVADFITAGMLKLTGATSQTSTKATGKNVAAFMKVYNGNEEVGHWGSDGILVKTGKIQLGSPKTINGSNKYPFYVDGSSFNITAFENNQVAAEISSSAGISLYKGSIRLGTARSVSGNNRYPCYISSSEFNLTAFDGSNNVTAEISSARGLTLNKGTITLGSVGSGKYFHVDSEGSMTCYNATINGRLSSVDGTFSGTLSGVDGTFSGTVSSGAIVASNITGSTFELQDGGDIVRIRDGRLKTQGTWIQLCGNIDDPDYRHLAFGDNHCAYHERDHLHIEVSSEALIAVAYQYENGKGPWTDYSKSL